MGQIGSSRSGMEGSGSGGASLPGVCLELKFQSLRACVPPGSSNQVGKEEKARTRLHPNITFFSSAKRYCSNRKCGVYHHHPLWGPMGGLSRATRTATERLGPEWKA